MKRTMAMTVCGLLLASTNAGATMIGGVEFPDGIQSFADAVVSYSPGPDVSGGFGDPSNALGAPDLMNGYGYSTSLGEGGILTLQFTDNSLTTSGDSSDDLYIFENGPKVENFNVAISTDNLTYLDLGDFSGQPTGVDIDAIAGVTPGDQYSYVRLSDIPPNQTGLPYGEADIDAVGAISSTAPVAQSVPEPRAFGILALGGALLLGGLGLRRRADRQA